MKRTVILLLSLTMAVACVKEDVEIGNRANPHEEGVEILQPRDPSLPTVPNRAIRSMSTRATNSGFTKLEDFVGRSYNNITSILGDQENILYPVIDLERLRADHPSYLKKDGLFKSEMSSYAYSTDEEYERKSSVTNKISTGFRLNLGFFSIGRKRVIENTFTSHVTQSTQNVYGELSVEILNALYSMMTSTLSNRRIAAEYLDPDFIEQLYNLTIDELLSVYGPFVLTGYYTGGRASALYLGFRHYYSTAEASVRGLQTSMEAACIFNKSDSLGFGFGYSNNDSEAERMEEMFESVEMTLRTIGGGSGMGVGMGAKKITDVNLDLSSWLESLQNPDNHAVIGIQDGGLHPISDFLLEENFCQRISEVHNNRINTTQQQLPYIEIASIRHSAMQMELLPVLNTRHGDKIILPPVPEMFPGGFNGLSFAQIINSLAQQKAHFFKLEIRKGLKEYTGYEPESLFFRVEKVNEIKMYKFVNEKNNMVYLYDPEQKFAFSFPNDDYTVDVYGIREWVETTRTRNLNILDLCNNYRVIGL